MNFESDLAIHSSVNIPEVELFISAPFEQELEIRLIEISELNIPDEEVPLEIPETSIPEPVYSKPDKIAVAEDEIESFKEDDKTDTVEAVQQTIIAKDIVPVVETGKTAVDNTEEVVVEIRGEIGQDINIVLDKEGWIYVDGDSSSSVKLKAREFSDSGTTFTFTISDGGEYTLNFRLQKLSSGFDENISYKIVVDDPDYEVSGPVVINPEVNISEERIYALEPSELTEAVEEENIPDIISSFNQFTVEDEPLDSQLAFDAFNLLEQQGGYSQYLVNLAEDNYRFFPYDNMSAEMLYKAALAIEQPGPLQNIEKALTLFKLVRDNFPISIFCDKSEERIRYLERHFMKIY